MHERYVRAYARTPVESTCLLVSASVQSYEIFIIVASRNNYLYMALLPGTSTSFDGGLVGAVGATIDIIRVTRGGRVRRDGPPTWLMVRLAGDRQSPDFKAESKSSKLASLSLVSTAACSVLIRMA